MIRSIVPGELVYATKLERRAYVGVCRECGEAFDTKPGQLLVWRLEPDGTESTDLVADRDYPEIRRIKGIRQLIPNRIEGGR